MSKTMLEYSKTVLKNVSFDRTLFFKEIEKAFSNLLPDEIEELKLWIKQFVTDKPDLQEGLLYSLV